MSMAIDLKGKVIEVTPTVDTNIYASGDQLGSLMTLTDALDATNDCALLKSITITDKILQNSMMDVLFFDSAPTLTSVDNGALSISDAEMSAKCIGIVNIPSASYVSLAVNSVVTVKAIDLLLRGVAGSRDLFAIIRCGGTPTYTSTSDLTLKFGLQQY